jgi:hypothetical protein
MSQCRNLSLIIDDSVSGASFRGCHGPYRDGGLELLCTSKEVTKRSFRLCTSKVRNELSNSCKIVATCSTERFWILC